MVAKGLQVVDLAASIIAKERKIPMYVFDLTEKDSIINAVNGKSSGTKITV